MGNEGGSFGVKKVVGFEWGKDDVSGLDAVELGSGGNDLEGAGKDAGGNRVSFDEGAEKLGGWEGWNWLVGLMVEGGKVVEVRFVLGQEPGDDVREEVALVDLFADFGQGYDLVVGEFGLMLFVFGDIFDFSVGVRKIVMFGLADDFFADDAEGCFGDEVGVGEVGNLSMGGAPDGGEFDEVLVESVVGVGEKLAGNLRID